jgi:hypothetical protein
MEEQLRETRLWVASLADSVAELERRSVIRVKPPRPDPPKQTVQLNDAAAMASMFGQGRFGGQTQNSGMHSLGPPPLDTPVADVVCDIINHLELDMTYQPGSPEKKPSAKLVERTATDDD